MSDEIDDGGPAFPVKHLDSELYYPGLTIRDWVAGQAASGFCSNVQWSSITQDIIAKSAYSIADAMIKERNK